MIEPLFHEGELFLQGNLGKENVKEAKEFAMSRVLKSIPKEYQNFIVHRPFTVISSLEPQTKQVWSSIIFANSSETEKFEEIQNNSNDEIFNSKYDPYHVSPSAISNTQDILKPYFIPFIEFLDEKTIKIKQLPLQDDPLRSIAAIKESFISLLFIEFETQKRIRLNGKIKAPLSENGFEVELEESFTNCSRYIHQRKRINNENFSKNHQKVIKSDKLTQEMKELILESDTFFIATASHKHGADSSMRGGNKGFVRVLNDSTLLWGDYQGRNLFQTLGNIVQLPSSGLLFVDFSKGDILQLQGEISIENIGDQLGLDFSDRNVAFKVKKAIYYQNASPYLWKTVSLSSFCPILTEDRGNHNQEAESLQINFERYNTAKITNIEMLSTDIRKFTLYLREDILFEYGQFGTFTFFINGKQYQRCYVIYEKNKKEIVIIVKLKENGVVTPWIFNQLCLGSQFILNGIEGNFLLKNSEILSNHKEIKSPKIILFSSEIGILSYFPMLKSLDMNGKDFQIHLIHFDKTFESISLKNDLIEISKRGIQVTLSLSNHQKNEDEIISQYFPLSSFSQNNQEFLTQISQNLGLFKPNMKEEIIYISGTLNFIQELISHLHQCPMEIYDRLIFSFNYD